MAYREAELRAFDTALEWNQFLVGAARSPAQAALPYLKAMIASVRRQMLIGHILLERGAAALNDPDMAARAVQAAGFTRPWDVVVWLESGRSVYAAWQKARAAGDFSLMTEEADKRYALARGLGRRRMDMFNRIASRHGGKPLTKISESFVQRQTPGLDTVELAMMSEDAAFWTPLYQPAVREYRARHQNIPRLALARITPDDKMALARRLLDKDPDGLSHVDLRAMGSPLCQGYGRQVGMGLAPDHPFFIFLKSYRHERAHAAYRTHLKGQAPGAALDELLPLMDEHFTLPGTAECQEILGELKAVMGVRFPTELTAAHIAQGFASLEGEDMAGDPDFVLYAVNRAIHSRAEAAMLDEAIPMARFPDVLAAHVYMFTGRAVTRREAEDMALSRFQTYFAPGRGTAYEAAIYAAASLAERLKGLSPEERRLWLYENLYSRARTPSFMEAVETLTGRKLSPDGLEAQVTAGLSL